MLKRLVEQFDVWETLPVEIADVREAIIDLGVQEKIIYSPQPVDERELRGAFYSWNEHHAPYGDPQRVSLIVYSNKQDKYWQRVVCCKETIHIFDSTASRTDKPDEVVALAEQLMGPVSSETHGLADLMAVTDRLALYQAVCILFPEAAREIALAQLTAASEPERPTVVGRISDWAQIPLELVTLVLSDQWPEIRQIILALPTTDVVDDDTQ